ncbi:MAG: TRL-like family protein [Spirochaetaceae bacterium]|jgi:hypothetical protein|nr:TRL-like family protein [Spirochaetaceae bacterium]
MIKKFMVTALLCAAVLAGCASSPASSLFNGPHPTLSNVNGGSSKTGFASSKVWLSFFGDVSYPTISEAASNGHITKIATVEYYNRPGILFLWTEYTTIVTGE